MDGSSAAGDMDLGDVILASKGSVGYDRLSEMCGGTPTGARLHQLVKASGGPPVWTTDGEPLNPPGESKYLKAVPKLDTLFGLRRLTGVAWSDLMLAAVRSCGVVVPTTVPKLAALIPDDVRYLDDDEVADLLRTIRFAAQRARVRHQNPSARTLDQRRGGA